MIKAKLHAVSALLMWTLATPLAVAQTQDVQARDAAPATDMVWVRIDGRPLFALRGTPSYPAQRRATEVAQRITAVARDHSIPESSV